MFSITSMSQNWHSCDANRDGVVDVSDITTVANYILHGDTTVNPPQDIISEESFFKAREDYLTALNACYANFRDFELSQLLLEHSRLTGKKIEPRDKDIANAWSKAYTAINYANLVIENGEANFATVNRLPINDVIAHAHALRAITYYNMSILWGDIVLINSSTNSTDQANKRSSRDEVVMPFVYNELQQCLNTDFAISEFLTNHKFYLNNSAIAFALTEVELFIKNHYSAKNHISSVRDIEDDVFLLSLQNINNPLYIETFGSRNEQLIYSPQYAKWLLEELNGEKSFVDDWFNTPGYEYGLWAFLLRNNLAKDMAKCEDYELLMPIPASEIMLNPGITQNEGY